MKNILFVFSFSFLVVSCSDQPPVNEDKLILIYTDFMFAQDTSLINNKNVDSVRTEIFARHNITPEDYQRTLDFYNRTPEKWESFFDKVIARIEKLKSNSADSLNTAS